MATAHKNLSVYDKSSIPSAKNLRIGIVVAAWNSEVTEALYRGAIATLLDCGATQNNIIRYTVPGSFELPFACKKLITTENPDVIIAIGSVIQGETKHFDFVCSATAAGIMQLNTTGEVPVIFCVLTDNNQQQAIDRSGGKHGNKGIEAAIAAIQMATIGA